jgi:hypothetical protein
MDTFAGIATHLGEEKLHLRVDILDTILNQKIAREHQLMNLLKAVGKSVVILLRKKTNRMKHLHMRHIAKHISLSQVEIQLAVATDGELLDKFIC